MRNATINTLCAAPRTAYDFADKKVLVMGLGQFGGGVDVAEFAVRAGAKVVVTDLASAEQLNTSIDKLSGFSDIEFHLGSHEPADFEQADIVIANPAVPGDNEFLELARKKKKFITSQINIFFELCPARIIGITGANGKSTTAALTAHILQNARYDPVIASEAKQSKTTQNAKRRTRYEDVWLSGNIGNQPLLMMLEKIKANDLVVLELSSFQLEQLAQIRKAPKVALLTNLTPNHLDRYGTFDNYCTAKESIFSLQHLDENSAAVSIFNAEDEISIEWFEKYKNDTGRLCIKFSTSDVSEDIREVFHLPGCANLSNLAAAMVVARHFGISDEQVKNCLPEFKALPHRLELIGQINGVSWYNDSKATTPKSAVTALEAFDEPVIIIAGGYDKNLPFDEFGKKIAEKAKAAILIGQTAPKIAEAIKEHKSTRTQEHKSISEKTRGTSDEGRATKNIHVIASEAKQSQITRYATRNTQVENVDSLSDAVNLANELAETGDIILLSPACASYDMFENFEQRGNEFTKLVKSLNK